MSDPSWKFLNRFAQGGSTWWQIRLWPGRPCWLTWSVGIWRFQGKTYDRRQSCPYPCAAGSGEVAARERRQGKVGSVLMTRCERLETAGLGVGLVLLVVAGVLVVVMWW